MTGSPNRDFFATAATKNVANKLMSDNPCLVTNGWWWHDNDHHDDKNAMMNSGYTEFRKRYFDHFQEYVNENFEDLGIYYDLEQGPRGPIRLRNVGGNRWVKSGVNLGFLPNKGGPRELRGPIRSRKREFIQLYRRN